MGTASEFMITPYGSLIVGFCSGIISTLGYLFLTVSFALLYSTEIAHIEVKEMMIMYLFKMWMVFYLLYNAVKHFKIDFKSKLESVSTYATIIFYIYFLTSLLWKKL